MSQIVVPADIRDRLAHCRGVTEFIDESGRKLGTFVPEPICPWEPGLTEPEIDRRAAGPTRNWAEIRQRLERMRPSR